MPARGDNLSKSRHGIWIWRKVHPITGKRVKKTTGTRNRIRAFRRAVEFEDEFERVRLGLPVQRHDPRLLLAPLVPEWVSAVAQDVETDRWLAEKERNLREALAALGIEIAADLRDLPRLTGRLGSVDGVLRRRRLQDELRRFVRWLSEDQRYLPNDPLVNWKRVKRHAKDSSEPRALAPVEAAWLFRAIEALDGLHHRQVSQRMPILLLLISGPRIGALCQRDVADFRLPAQRISYGRGSGKKRRGEGALDRKTFAELSAYVGERDSGPLCLSPRRGRIDTSNLRKDFAEAHSLAAVRMNWPKELAFDWELGSLVSRHLSKGGIPLKGGSRLRRETLRARAALADRARTIAGEIGVEWRAQVFKSDGRRVGPHELRDTIETWCRDLDVPAAAIDRQLGHAGRAGSATGRRFYYDTRLRALEFEQVTGARLVATKVREVLDSAQERIQPIDQ